MKSCTAHVYSAHFVIQNKNKILDDTIPKCVDSGNSNNPTVKRPLGPPKRDTTPHLVVVEKRENVVMLEWVDGGQ